jgi:leucyl aminopeptidase
MLSFASSLSSDSEAFAIFVNDKLHFKDRKNLLSQEVRKKINSYLSNLKDKKNEEQISSLDITGKQKCFIIKVKKKYEEYYPEEKGGIFYSYLKNFKSIKKIDMYIDSLDFEKEEIINFSSEFIFGYTLKSYTFNKYKTSDKENSKKNITYKIITSHKEKIKKKYEYNDAIKSGIFLTRDLVSEPGNILHPDEYAKRLVKLKKYGLKVTVYDEKKLKKLGCNALVGVGQGSIRGSYLVTIEWNGNKSKSKPLAFVGKGVCFDTGGISLKPAKFMEDMTYDMAGSAVVVGLMKNFALRKAKVNAVGVVGLVENMPGGNAQRPGDIVKSYSGKTIEVLNTDAEGRLVLADAITFTEKKFKPNLIVDLATLTGAIIVSLGSEYAGLFSNDDKLSKQIFDAGKKVDEKVWRLPLHKKFDKLMDSKTADMQNINYVGGAGSITAAQFLQRFIINKTPWAHLDIAGMAFSNYAGALNPGGATGYGVRLLNKFVEDNYE